MRCEWPICKKESFFGKDHFAQHLNHHRNVVKGNFVAPGLCQWPGCRARKSRTTFQNEANFDRHLKLHMKLHWCNVTGCRHGEGFARQHDLARHMKTHSKEHAFYCPDSSCTSSSTGFPRKDKLDTHIKVRHSHLIDDIRSRRCGVHGCTAKKPFNSIEDLQAHFATTHEYNRPHHCPVQECARHNNGFTTQGRLSEHIKAEHDPPKCTFDHCDFRSLGSVMTVHCLRIHTWNAWECKLPGCEGSKFAFGREKFRIHLSSHHGISIPDMYDVFDARNGNINSYHDETFVACKYCLEHRSQSDQNEV